MLNLDTHVLLCALAGTLTKREREVLPGAPWGVAAIVLWELARLRQLGRVSLELEDPHVARVLRSLHVWPLDLEVAMMSTRLDFRGDPADELIAATSVVHQVPLVTRDAVIRKSKLVPLAV
jgi:PIN domain nuclease of toxin-antitoxin system